MGKYVLKSFYIKLLFISVLILPVQSSALQLSVTSNASDTTVGSRIGVAISLSDFTMPGLSTIHMDFSYDTSVLSLVDARAGDFFSNNIQAGSNWADASNQILATGDAVDTSITDSSSGPDILGFDFMEWSAMPSFFGGDLVLLTFDTITTGSADFGINDNLMLNDLGTPCIVDLQIMDLKVSAVPEPGTLMLFSMGLFIAGCINNRFRRPGGAA